MQSLIGDAKNVNAKTNVDAIAKRHTKNVDAKTNNNTMAKGHTNQTLTAK